MAIPAYRSPEDPGLWEAFLERLEKTLRVAAIHPTTVEYLAHPKRLVTVSLPVVMDDGKVRVFQGYRVVHDIARGPAKGGGEDSSQGNPGPDGGPGRLDDLEGCRLRSALWRGSGGGLPPTPGSFPAGSLNGWCAVTPLSWST